jgi:hydrogenase-4 component E
MEQVIDLLLIGVILSALYTLGTQWLTSCIRTIAVQGIALGILPLFLHHNGFSAHLLAFCIGMVALKGFVVPTLLLRAIREVALRKEGHPLIGFNASVIIGIGLVGFGFLVTRNLPLPAGFNNSLFVPAAFAMLMIGLLIVVSRAKLVTQVVGYLILENGIYIFGLTLAAGLPELIEIGVLFNALVGVLISGIVIGHVNQMFGSVSSHKLSSLKE